MILRQRSVITKRKAATGKTKAYEDNLFLFKRLDENGNKMFVALTIVWE
jgi:hypothetical protein